MVISLRNMYISILKKSYAKFGRLQNYYDRSNIK